MFLILLVSNPLWPFFLSFFFSPEGFIFSSHPFYISRPSFVFGHSFLSPCCVSLYAGNRTWCHLIPLQHEQYLTVHTYISNIRKRIAAVKFFFFLFTLVYSSYRSFTSLLRPRLTLKFSFKPPSRLAFASPAPSTSHPRRIPLRPPWWLSGPWA